MCTWFYSISHSINIVMANDSIHEDLSAASIPGFQKSLVDVCSKALKFNNIATSPDSQRFLSLVTQTYKMKFTLCNVVLSGFETSKLHVTDVSVCSCTLNTYSKKKEIESSVLDYTRLLINDTSLLVSHKIVGVLNGKFIFSTMIFCREFQLTVLAVFVVVNLPLSPVCHSTHL